MKFYTDAIKSIASVLVLTAVIGISMGAIAGVLVTTFSFAFRSIV